VSGTAKAGAASLWRSVRVVAWSFVGIRKGSESQEDMARVNPFHIIGVGIAAAAFFVVSLVILVNWVVAK
jgi:hypothetical protein